MTPPNPFNKYGRTKYQAEEVLTAWHARGSDTRTLALVRPTVVFGERNRDNVYNLLRQIASGRFMMIGSGENVKSMAYVGNIVAFLNHALTLGPGRHVCNYVDTPEFDMNQLVTQVRGKLTGKYDVGPRMPLAVGMAIGHAFDLVAKLTGKTFPISAIRVQKFTSFTQFSSAARSRFWFEPPFTIQEGLDRTLETEFLSPDPDADLFYTE